MSSVSNRVSFQAVPYCLVDAEETGTNSRSEEEPRHPDSKFKFSYSILCYYVLLAQLVS